MILQLLLAKISFDNSMNYAINYANDMNVVVLFPHGLEEVGAIELKTFGAKSIQRTEDKVEVTLENNEKILFDKVVCATHANQTYHMIKDISVEEKRILEPWEYSKNKTILHTDISLMSPTKSAWACWNYVKNKDSKDGDEVSVTYYMNRLQGLKTEKDYLVTLNPTKIIPENKIIYETEYTHPKYTNSSLRTQKY